MKKMTYVYVLNKKGEPLMPTTRCGHVRKLLKAKKAVVVKNNPFTIRLKYDTPNGVQDVFAGIDSGRENIGTGASDEEGNCLYLGELHTSNKSIKSKMQKRAGYRSERRRHDRQNKQRKARKDGTEISNGDDSVCRTKIACRSVKISYPTAEGSVEHKIIRGKEGKFANRKRPDGWITPSARQCVQMHLNALKSMREILPVSHVTLERVTFDFQKLENQDIKRWEYGKGILYGFDTYKDYIFAEQKGRCLLCGCDRIDHYHHIHQRKKNGIDHVSNIAGLCDKCHHEVHTDQSRTDELESLKKGCVQKYQIGLLNSVMPELIEQVSAFCEKNDIKFSICEGRDTADIRNGFDLPKDHCMDGYCISLVDRDIVKISVVPDRIHTQQRYKKKSKNMISKCNVREYYHDGKLVARNRHKATDQKEDSLEEYMSKYAETHTDRECRQHFAQLMIKPAKRTYTFHKDGLISPIHAGDIVRYEKHNKIRGNTKVDTFVATGVVVATGHVKCGSESKKLKFCRRIQSGCTPFVESREVIFN